MKTIIKKYSIVFIMIFLLIHNTFLSCENFVEVDLPPNQLTGKGIFDANRTAEAAVTDMYAYQREEGLLSGTAIGLSNLLALYTDEFTRSGSSDGDYFEFSTHNVQPNNRILNALWNSSFKTIYAANAAIEGIQASENLDDQVAQRLLGEAYFMRALIHFYLTELYGDIPYINTTNYKINTSIAKNTSEEVNNFIIADLLLAEKLIPESYLSPQHTRPNRMTVKALLSRVYLNTEQWADAEREANEIIASGLYTLDIPLDQVFLIDSPGTLWQFKSEYAGYNTLEAQAFIILAPSDQYTALSRSFVASFEEGDQRREQWIDSISGDGNTLYFPYKYKEYSPTPTSLEYPKLFRIAEIYLNRAEARLRLKDLNGAGEDINAVRKRAGLAEITTTGFQDLEMALLKERRAELFTEFGHRWFDLKRFDRAEAILSPIKSGWGNSSYLFPLPETEISANPNLKPQNPGY